MQFLEGTNWLEGSWGEKSRSAGLTVTPKRGRIAPPSCLLEWLASLWLLWPGPGVLHRKHKLSLWFLHGDRQRRKIYIFQVLHCTASHATSWGRQAFNSGTRATIWPSGWNLPPPPGSLDRTWNRIWYWCLLLLWFVILYHSTFDLALSNKMDLEPFWLHQSTLFMTK